MSELSQKDLDAAIEDHMMREQRESLFLNQLLGKFRRQASRHFVLQVQMGEVSSYLTSVRLSWVHQKVRFAADLPIFREISEGSKRISVDPETVEIVQQRQPDWRRQLEMATYLTTTHHKFPPLLLVGWQHWVYEEKDEKWGTDARATCDSLTLTGLDPTGIYWALDDIETEFYALDGQHRLMAILGLRDLIQNGKLHALDKDGNPKKGRSLSREEIIDYLHNSTGKSHADIHERLQCLMDERIGVEIVPAVCQGETYDEALRRLRQLFVDVNEHAKRLSSSELVQLDENNGYRVVCRRLILLDENKLCHTAPDTKWPKVDTTRITLPERSNSYTTLKTLAEIVKRYLTENKSLPESDKYVSWGQAIAKGIYFRPDEKELDRGKRAMMEYFKHLASIPSHQAFINGKRASELRRSKGGEDNILFRPMVQMALAEAIGKLVTSGVSLSNIVKELGRQEQRGQLRLTERTAPWFGVLCDSSGKMRRYKRSENLCCRLFQYLLGGGIEDDDDRGRLREDFAAERRIDLENDMAIDLNGNTVETDKVRLPNPWR